MTRSLLVCGAALVMVGCKQLPPAPTAKLSDAQCQEIETAINSVLPGAGVRYSANNEMTVQRATWSDASKEDRYRMVSLEAKASACRFSLPPSVQTVKVRDGMDGSLIGEFTIESMR